MSFMLGTDCMRTWLICNQQVRIGRSENDGGFYWNKELYSVKKTDNRPQFQQMIKDSERGIFDD